MLYIDQPNMVGYSYDIPVNGTINQLFQDPRAGYATVQVDNFAESEIPKTNDTFFVGTFPSQNPAHTANSTENATPIIWHLLQTLFQE
jgi:hypothetical protein